MIEPESLEQLQRQLRERINADRGILDQLRNEIRNELGPVRRIQPRSTTAISLVGTDGGNNRVEFDPFLAQLVRVVDSSNNEYVLEVITPSTDVASLSRRHRPEHEPPLTPLGRMMEALGVTRLWDLSPVIQAPPKQSAPSWTQVYRELTQWAVLLELVQHRNWGTDTLLVCDGLLRSKVFAGTLFLRMFAAVKTAIDQHQRAKRRIFVVGLAKHSKVLERYRLAMALEGIMRTDYPCYAQVSRSLEKNVYKWSEYARGNEETDEGEANKFVAGKMFFVKFGKRPRDPIWPVDILEPQVPEAQVIFGSLLADAIDGFPVPFYPRCLQRAHESAALVDFDMDIMQRAIIDAIRQSLGSDSNLLDELRLTVADPASRRYE